MKPINRMKCIFKAVCLFGVCFLIIHYANAQNDTTQKKVLRKHPPRMAALMSTVIPGLGQAYNKKYWKIPIIYAAFTGLVYAIDYNKKEHTTYFKQYKARLDNDSIAMDALYDNYTNDNLLALIDYHQRYRDLSYIGFIAVYLLNIVDASVDAHLFYFDVSDELSLKITPNMYYSSFTQTSITGLSLSLKINAAKTKKDTSIYF